jgi:hypothetical protein
MFTDGFFSLVSGFEVELGYFTLSELKEARGPLGLQIERDLPFEPKTLRELQKWHQNHYNVLFISRVKMYFFSTKCTRCTTIKK